MRTGVFFLLICLWAPVYADSPDILVAPLKQPAAAGASMDLSIYYHNTNELPISMTFENELACRLNAGDQTIDIKARRLTPENPGPIIIGARSYAKARYTLRLPEDLEGPARLQIPQLGDTGLDFMIHQKQSEEEAPLSWLPETTDEPLDALIQLYQPYVKNISFYEPMYFLVGTDPKYSKFQLSLKYRMFNPDKPFLKKHPWLTGFHFGYTQTSFWDLASDSAPFEDTSYKPELFYITNRLKTKIPALDGLFLRTGVRHESNGLGGEFSRSTNIAYIEPIFIFFNERRRTGIKIAPRVWTYFNNEDENNPDIDRYRGYFNLGITIGKADSMVINTQLWWAAEGASVQFDATYPLHTLFFSDLDLYFQVQYANRLAESLLNYTERTQALRLGFAIVR